MIARHSLVISSPFGLPTSSLCFRSFSLWYSKPLHYGWDETQTPRFPVNNIERRRNIGLGLALQNGSDSISEFLRNRNSFMLNQLPITCPGCGAFSQIQNLGEAGHYSIQRRQVKKYLKLSQGPAHSMHDNGLKSGTLTLGDDLAKQWPTAKPSSLRRREPSVTELEPTYLEAPQIPVCDRCHHIAHHGTGGPVIHPSLEAVEDMMSDSPHSTNHIYHVLDAADFPLSLIPNLQERLHLMPQRSRNRRMGSRYLRSQGRSDISFVITRSDLLAPQKEQVDALMPYLRDVLRQALDISREGIRLGNVFCVSSHRGWWTKQVKEEIWKRGGGIWAIGKVNVGKSQFVEAVFPKGGTKPSSGALSRPLQSFQRSANLQKQSDDLVFLKTDAQGIRFPRKHEKSHFLSSGGSALPPQPIEVPYPRMPTVSHLPGTTASPIRIPFGDGRGELFDLPGLQRNGLECHVQDRAKVSLTMTSRVKAAQYTVKPGQSLLIADLIMMTPKSPETVFLICPFVPLNCHVTNTEKAKSVLQGATHPAVQRICRLKSRGAIASAGLFKLKWDVTRQRSGPLTDSRSAKLEAKQLPFVVFSIDILIEGMGWVEIVTQVRKSLLESKSAGKDFLPVIEVFSPNGKHIGCRRPMGAWAFAGKR